MLPAEITTLSGSDFDVDKLYIMLPEFKVHKYDMMKARKDFAKENAIFSAIISVFNNSQLMEDVFDEDTNNFKEWFNENKEKYKFVNPKIRKVEYNFAKAPHENNLQARNNLLIDLMYGVLTNSDTSSKILNPGGFDYQKKAARIATILTNTYESDLAKALNEGGVVFDKVIIRGGKTVKAPISSYLFDLPLELSNKEREERKKNGKPFISLTELAEKTKRKLDPISPRT